MCPLLRFAGPCLELLVPVSLGMALRSRRGKDHPFPGRVHDVDEQHLGPELHGESHRLLEGGS